jgi:hypothetical protein
MNDPQYVEAACGLAERSARDGGDDPQLCAVTMFRRCTARAPSDDELAEMVGEFEDHRRHYTEDLAAAEQLLAVGELKVEDAAECAELAAWTMVANMVLNLDEVVTKN